MWIGLASASDVLSVVLSRLKLEAFATGAFDAGGAWAIEFPPTDALSFKVITKGECWLAIEGEEQHYHLKTGDCFLISGSRSFVLAKDLKAKKKISSQLLAHSRGDNGVAVYNGGGDVISIGTMFRFEGHFSNIILKSLPAIIHIPAHLDQAAVLRWSLERFVAEFQGRSTGYSLMMGYLAPIIFLQTLRLYLALTHRDKNWLVALSHPKLSKAMEAIHVHYRMDWSLETLAMTSGMSRAGFALNFKMLVGVSPIDYLTNWRMQIACDLLQEGRSSIAEIASTVGYGSESAFSAAFKKIIKCRPGFYQKNRSSTLDVKRDPLDMRAS
ncbi:AraC family transcriptional regulator [Acidisoma cladoniae]|jgi:AraC-like DNA-binding protein|uniref:AraC family transcriptional regulator n=1 Tax=Acidisoma cladoniae TaxID=3040935 RepID=UPI00254B273D|nr:AraC family transcriptional regulator [Acidisoma sp. PAMC 29798]